MKFNTLSLALLALPLGAIAQSATQTAPAQNIVSFSAEVEQEVSRDLWQVRLFYQTSGNNLTALNKQLKEKLDAAINAANTQKTVEIRDSSRNTFVNYHKNGKQNGWTARAEITLESRDSEALSNVLNKLDGVMAIENIDAQISSEKLANLENQLTEAALTKFKNKANLIQQSLAMKGYRIVELDISSVNEQHFGAMPYAAMARSISVENESSNEPALQTSKEKIKAKINARIALLNE